MVVLTLLVIVLPFRAAVDHFAGHAALWVPLAGLLIATFRWPPPHQSGLARLARLSLIVGIALSGLGLLIESIGAFGFADDESTRVESLAALHDAGNLIWIIGLPVLMTGGALSVLEWVTRRRGIPTDSRRSRSWPPPAWWPSSPSSRAGSSSATRARWLEARSGHARASRSSGGRGRAPTSPPGCRRSLRRPHGRFRPGSSSTARWSSEYAASRGLRRAWKNR